MCVELDKPDLVVEDILPILSHKLPKSVAAGIAALTMVYRSFGCKIVDPKPVLKALPKAFAHADKNVRAEAQGLTVELYRWLKEAIKPLFWADLKPVQQQDLEKAFENVKQEGPPKQERFTKAQQDAMAEASAAPPDGERGVGEDGDGGEEYGDDADGELDAFDLAEPVDVMSKAPRDLHESLASSKWKDRKDALDALHDALNVPRIKDAPYDDLVRALAKCMKDANVAVVTVAANCVVLLAKGLRKNFGKYRSIIMVPLLERLKERKQSVADALGQALDAVFETTSLGDCLEDTMEYLQNKNPQVKQGTLSFLIRSLRTTTEVPSKADVKSISEAAIKLLAESSEAIRSGGAEILGTLMKIMGERSMNPYVDELDDIRKKKIKEYFETAQVKAKDRPKPIMVPSKAVVTANATGKKIAASGKKPATALKKPVSSLSGRSQEEPTPSSPSKTAVKPRIGGASKPGGLPTPGSGLKKAAGGPGRSASPQRRAVSPPVEGGSAPAPPTAPKLGLGRSLAGRPIAKPSHAVAESASTGPPTPRSSGISAIERAELGELRAENERFSKMVEDLRSDRTKLKSQVAELQNQNAQLIEDHTKDVLSIKAKETQLVRARSDAESAEQTVQKQQRDIERLKRELARALLASAMSPTDDALFADGANNGGMQGVRYESAGYESTGNGYGAYNLSSRLQKGDNRRRSYMTASPSEEKENTEAESPGRISADGMGRRKLSPNLGSSYAGAMTSPTRPMLSSGDDSNPSGKVEPAQNWRRAAEVTSQLKERIERMKVCFSIIHLSLFSYRLTLSITGKSRDRTAGTGSLMEGSMLRFLHVLFFSILSYFYSVLLPVVCWFCSL